MAIALDELGSGTLRVVLVVLVVLLVLLGLLYVGQRKLIYLPGAADPGPATEHVAAATELVLNTEDGVALGAWLIPADAQTDRGMAVLVANGNAGSRASRAPFAAELRDAGFTVLLFDYRGYGGNDGNPTEEGLALDVRAAQEELTEAGFPAERTLYYGESLGTGVVTELALERPPAGLVLRSPYTDLAALGRSHYPILPVRTLLWDRYPTIDRIGEIRAPTTVIYGGADSIVPPEQSREVAAAAGNLHEELEIPGADHNDAAMFTGAELIGAVERLGDAATG
ncbi:alpha/beta fold hydrolase [Lipingzhangella sp. LS1_29]|uniref:Alpha/beta fold hydrolase n=1 Tax=Lipingzhangella rawalii TaxID=2055835 RepID=A0ABU2HBG5_9ACTN|nr:alpha/beta fold hydrolase [Lipingzhangella rawalii]MDS1272184.1 alpha/beta fold hydrolase [Lipingzhangella rawalii]